MKKRDYTRREFLQGSTAAAAAGALYFSLPGEMLGKGEKKTKVVLIRHRDVLDEMNKPRGAVVQQMLDEAVSALTEVADPVRAWKKLIRPDDTVGIKTNAWRYIPTPKELEDSIRRRVMDAGVDEKRISINDRGVRKDPVFRNATALINARPLRTHHWSGVGTLLKNYIMFVENPSDYHPDTCADLAKIWELPVVKGKTRLNILVCLTPQFHGVGPHSYSPEHVWSYNGLLVGFDPVAVDSVGVRILMAKRKLYFKDDRPLNPPPKHIFLADTRHGLGTADPDKIELIRLGWMEEALI